MEGNARKALEREPTNGVIYEDGEIVHNGLRIICPHCGEVGLSQGRGGSVNIWTVGAIECRECTKCRSRFNTIMLTVPDGMTPEGFYSAIKSGHFANKPGNDTLAEEEGGRIDWKANGEEQLLSADR